MLEDHGDAENQDEVNADDTEGSSEDLIKVFVGEGRERANATTLLRCNKGIGAGSVLNKWRCSGIDISTAVKLF